MEISDLNEKEIRELAAQQWVGLLLGSTGFVVQKLGSEGAKEFTINGAKNTAHGLRTMGINSPKSFALNDAVKWKNVYGSDIEVEEEGDDVVINHNKCACLNVVLDMAKKGMPVTKEQHCAGCVMYYRNVLENLGMKLEPQLIEEGCVFRISDKEVDEDV